jgi:hypothetical protein
LGPYVHQLDILTDLLSLLENSFKSCLLSLVSS